MQFSLTDIVPVIAAPAGGGGSDGHGMAILPHPGELVFGLVLFLAFLGLIYVFVYPKLEQAYTDRVEAIEGDMGRAEKALAEAEALKSEYQGLIDEVRRDANQVREQARQEAAQIVAAMRQEATEEAQRIMEAAARQVEVERASALHALKGDVGRISTDLASRIVGESLRDDARQSGIIDRFLAELEDGTLQRELGGGQEASPR